MLGKMIMTAFGSTGSKGADSRVSFPSFLDLYDKQYASLLAVRAEGFRVMFRQLEAAISDKRARGLPPRVVIVETGSLRKPDSYAGDGASTVLFDAFVNYHDGVVFTVDLNPNAVALVRKSCSGKVHAVCSDSVSFLHDLSTLLVPQSVDLFYLDSLDFNPVDPFPSSFHHVKELLAVGKLLDAGTMVAIDDNVTSGDGKKVGKGALVGEYFENVGVEEIYSGHQRVWRL